MTDCPHEHQPDIGLQKFKDIVREEFDQESDSTRLFLKERVEECSPYEEIDRTEVYAAYKDWCVFNRFSPESARRFYGSIWDIFRIKMEKSNGRRLFKGI